MQSQSKIPVHAKIESGILGYISQEPAQVLATPKYTSILGHANQEIKKERMVESVESMAVC